MPTGYTAKLCEGEQSFSEFAAQCARAFGACIQQRDDPMHELPKTNKKSTYHEEQLAASKLELERLEKMTKKEITQYGRTSKAGQLQYYKEMIVKKKETRARIEKMIAQVTAWEPPAESYTEYKEFMLQQLSTTLDNDGNVSYYETELAKEMKRKLREYYDMKVESVRWSINYHTKEDAKEEERNTDRNKWITDLFESLNNYDGELAWTLLSRNNSM